jgi:Xaa-Pro dipeptidase
MQFGGNSMHENRLNRLLNLMEENQLDVVALNPGPSLKYLTNLNFHLMERPTVLLTNQSGKAALVFPALEKTKAEKCAIPCQLFSYADNPSTWIESFSEALNFLRIETGTIAVEPNRFRFLEMNYLMEACPTAHIISGENVFNNLRIIKDQVEINSMKKAAEIAEKSLIATLNLFKMGVSEKQLAAELKVQLTRFGSEGELPFEPIVASGPNSADPHSIPGDRCVNLGDILLFDWGAAYGGVTSDITRCFSIGKITSPFKEISDIVLKANQAGRETGKPGIKAGEIDLSTRKVIEKSGYGEFFTHRTGHGLGMEAHEAPYIFAENERILKEGMVYTIEPGIYLPGKGGIRIEDDVVVTSTGSLSLTTMPRNLLVLE